MDKKTPTMLPPTPPRTPSPPLPPFTGPLECLAPPPSPQRWRWRCHNCGARYRIATTRRCLGCSHYFCTTLTSPVMKPKHSPKRPKQLYKKRGSQTCASTFDYNGWARYNSWRRLALLSSPSSSSPSSSCSKSTKLDESYATFHPTPLSFFSAASDDDDDSEFYQKVQWTPIKTPIHRRRVVLAKERLYVEKKHNCFLHCDYPSECRHMLFEAYEQGRVKFVQDEENGCRWEIVDSGPEPEGEEVDSEMALF